MGCGSSRADQGKNGRGGSGNLVRASRRGGKSDRGGLTPLREVRAEREASLAQLDLASLPGLAAWRALATLGEGCVERGDGRATAMSVFAPVVRVAAMRGDDPSAKLRVVGLQANQQCKGRSRSKCKKNEVELVFEPSELRYFSAAMMETVMDAVSSGELSLFDILDDALVIRILWYLPLADFCHAAQVSLRLNLLTYDAELSTLWMVRTLATSRIRDSSLTRLAARSVSCILSLDLSNCQLVTDCGLRAILEVNPLMEDISLANCTGITRAGLMAVAELGTSLQRAVMPVTKARSHAESYSDIIEVMAANATELVELDIDGWVVSANALACLLKQCSSLERLTVSLRSIPGESIVDDVGFMQVCQYAHNIKGLVLNYPVELNSSSLTALLAHMGSLTALNIAHASFPRLALAPGMAPVLRVIHLNDVAIDDAGLASLIASTPSLYHFELRFCAHLTDTFLSSPLPPSLQTLVLTSCPISDRGVGFVARQLERLPRLLCLDLSHTNISEQSLSTLLGIGKSVPYIGIADCAAIQANSIIEFYMRRHKQLKKYEAAFLEVIARAEPPSRFHLPSGEPRPLFASPSMAGMSGGPSGCRAKPTISSRLVESHVRGMHASLSGTR
ncbi:uncharacterized protein AMSG_05485 [Thecamonas trahens ATCC 50062]|uniref:Uncharacterized protein n=1 Tax=Thecamonas trahens ATCC 50062 TaxID=461836 RepID=A0A0L0DBI4_THETB|nr:hypothetical protein AMSG_05485 [Thecamonas trahens ATCC 50062]KNC49471.1 hypothetical protein AMSG_05485 [Thecamonas trahens ATCC 50062]|eukprot:XP_013757890.1 hypothetical protein AMSG_05485 [Thecamonas trahens ATCC 50062]